MRNLVQNVSKLSNDRFWWKIRPTLGTIIFQTKWDKDKPIFSAERGGQWDWVTIKRGPKKIGICTKNGVQYWGSSLLPCTPPTPLGGVGGGGTPTTPPWLRLFMLDLCYIHIFLMHLDPHLSDAFGWGETGQTPNCSQLKLNKDKPLWRLSVSVSYSLVRCCNALVSGFRSRNFLVAVCVLM